MEHAADKYFSRMGWMPRAHPIELPNGRIIVPLYSDGYSFSLMAITDDGGVTWSTSEPLVGAGAIQPTVARKRDGALVAYMRDNGPPPKRLHTSTSRDDGVTWSPVVDTDIPNPGAGMEVINLKDGSWAMIYNDTERGRHSLVVAISEDGGQSWRWKRHLELDERGQGAGSFHYPSIIQSRDGTLHASYSYFLNHLPDGAPRKTIKHAHFSISWVKQGDGR
jgi:predicted neuraminidase